MLRYLKGTAAALAVTGMLAGSALADEFEATLKAALEAYRAGDIKLAKEEIDFAGQLLSQMKSAALSSHLPAPFEGWEREDDDNMQGMAAFGGGQAVGAVYRMGNKEVRIQVMADNQMVNALGAMFSNPALMGSMGKVKRLGRQKVVITNDGELQAMVGGRIMIQISGTAPIEDMEAYFQAIDIAALEAAI